LAARCQPPRQLNFEDPSIDDFAYPAIITSSGGQIEVTVVRHTNAGPLTEADFLFG
jgi:hypothetical protein